MGRLTCDHSWSWSEDRNSAVCGVCDFRVRFSANPLTDQEKLDFIRIWEEEHECQATD